MSSSVPQVVHVTSWLTRKGGGIPPVINALARETSRLGSKCTVAGLKDEFFDIDCVSKEFSYLGGAILGPLGFGYSRELNHLVANVATPDSVIHSHSVWMYPTFLARRVSKKLGCPLIITPHGMLEPWCLQHSKLKKRIAAIAFEDGNLRHAHCLHALCKPEAQNLRRIGLKNPIAIIPNGVDFATFQNLPDRDAITERHPELKGRRRILFLSRIHPKKGAPNLLKAWQHLYSKFKDWCVVITGPDELGHEQELKTLANELGIGSTVVFTGPMYGEDKRKILAGADLFVLPSFGEGFSMAVLEAAAANLPVLLTHECNFPELAAKGAGIEVSSDLAGVESGLLKLLGMSENDRNCMGLRGRTLVQQSYVWPEIGRTMHAVYAWLLGNGPQPECVTLE